jgi:hypothetical protein
MAQELGKIEKPFAEEYRAGKKIFYIPLIFSSNELTDEYNEKCKLYWKQVNDQISNLELSLGPVKKIFHELVTDNGEEGLKNLEKLKIMSYDLVTVKLRNGASLEAIENSDSLSELMDWSRCLSLGLQNKQVFSTVYTAYTEASNKRYEAISNLLADGIKENESCMVILGENHRVHFPSDAQIFYVAPPALDEVKRWLRDHEAKLKAEESCSESSVGPPETA